MVRMRIKHLWAPMILVALEIASSTSQLANPRPSTTQNERKKQRHTKKHRDHQEILKSTAANNKSIVETNISVETQTSSIVDTQKNAADKPIKTITIHCGITPKSLKARGKHMPKTFSLKANDIPLYSVEKSTNKNTQCDSTITITTQEPSLNFEWSYNFGWGYHDTKNATVPLPANSNEIDLDFSFDDDRRVLLTPRNAATQSQLPSKK